eukprot:SAG31_NODE_3811_length_3861_cov_3.645401_2_plen_454_part_00
MWRRFSVWWFSLALPLVLGGDSSQSAAAEQQQQQQQQQLVGEWTWVGGPAKECAADQLPPGSSCAGVYDAATPWPGARCCAHVFAPPGAELAYLFGGYGYDANGTLGYLNDLWQLHFPTITWQFIGGNRTCNLDGQRAWPAARSYAAYAFDADGNAFYIFSGMGGASDDFLPDLWRFDVSRLRWSFLGNFSTPSPRWWSNFWAADGEMYVLGGETDRTVGGTLNDMWSFNYRQNQWTLVSNRSEILGVYPPHPDPAPGARHNSFTASTGSSLYMFGGSGYGDRLRGVTSDLWRFDVRTRAWEFLGGVPGATEQNGTCGQRSIPSVRNLPTARHAGANFDQPGPGGRMLVLGGEHHPAPPPAPQDPHLLLFDDLWSYDLLHGKGWANEAGDCNVPNVPTAKREALGVPSRDATPQSRYGGNSFSDRTAAYTFGGGYAGYTNDLWSFRWPATRPV